MSKSTLLASLLLLVGFITTSFRFAVPSRPQSLSKKSLQQKSALASVSISGPYSLSMCDQGVWTANVSGASGSVSYEWYLTVPGNGYEPPVTHYVGSSNMFITYLDYWISFPDRTSIALHVDVYDNNGYAGTGHISVYAYPCY